MNSERWQQVDRLFQAALDCEASARGAFLDEACAGDEALRREVEAYLMAYEQAGDFLNTTALEAAAKIMAEGAEDQAAPNAATTVDDPSGQAHDDIVTLKIGQPVQTSPRSGPLAPGMTLGGRYVVEKELAQGGIGAVFLARDRKLHDAPVVIKALLDSLSQSRSRAWFENKFRQEIAALSRIDHPGVVRALDVGELPDGRTYLVIQFVPGVSLRPAISSRGMELKRAATLIRQIGQALTAAHQRGVIHRDLKPENIMLQEAGDQEHVKLIDFGIASVLDAAEEDGNRKTMIAGTPVYMAPEQLRGKPAAASDIYAFGVIAHEMVTGRRPFNPDSTVELSEMQRAGVAVKPRELRPDLPVAAEAAILKALSFAARDRHASAAEFGETLASALTAEAPDPAPPESLDPAPPESEKVAPKRAKRTIWALLAVLLMAAVMIGLWPRTPSESGEPERSLSYWLTVQRDPSRYPASKPFTLPGGETIFSAGDHVRLHVTSPQSGHLYIINEGPRRTSGLPEFNVLFPDATTRNWSAEIAADQMIQIPRPSAKPEQDWFVFDQEEGVEKIWLVWSTRSVPELEAVKRYANANDRGEVKSQDDLRLVAEFINANLARQPLTEQDETNKQTRLTGKGDVLVRVVKLEHH